MPKIYFPIRTQLVIIFSVLVIITVLEGYFTLNYSERLWKSTEDIYNHPLQVSNATRDIRYFIMKMDDSIDDYLFSEVSRDLMATRHRVDSLDLRISELFKIVDERYLGPESDLLNARMAYQGWKPEINRFFDLVESGRIDDARRSTAKGGSYSDSYAKAETAVLDLINFAKAKADTFYNEANDLKKDLMFRHILLTLVILTLFVVTFIFTVNIIRAPVRDLSEASTRLMQGDFSARSSYRRINEFGNLALAFNNMAESVQRNAALNTASNDIAVELMKEYDLNLFSKRLIEILMRFTNSQTGASYILNETTGTFDLVASAGLKNTDRKSFSALFFEGEIGASALLRDIRILTDIQPDKKIVYETSAADLPVQSIMTIPVTDSGTVVFVISLGSVTGFTSEAITLIKNIHLMLCSRIAGVIGFKKIRSMSDILAEQNAELGQKSVELEKQAGELREYTMELEIQKKKLEEATRLKSNFLSNMSHELRTPLNSINSLASILLKRGAGKTNKEDHRYLGIIEKNGKHLLSLVDSILELSRIESGRESVVITKFQLNDLIDSIIQSLEPLAGVKNISVQKMPAPVPVTLESDFTKCHHILQNIIQNAVKFTERGMVKIETRVSDAAICVEVSDTGIGIAPDKIAWIFDEFRQADEEASKKYGGMGLGLAIAVRYAAMLGGKIEVTSELGEGSVFKVHLPIKAAGQKPTGPGFLNNGKNGSENLHSDISLPGKIILVIEDNEVAYLQISEMIKDEGASAIWADSGIKALEMLGNINPDGIILDLMMPEMDGFEFLKRLKSDQKAINIPVMILTAKIISDDEMSEIKSNGITQFLRKGKINSTEFKNAIINLVSRNKY